MAEDAMRPRSRKTSSPLRTADGFPTGFEDPKQTAHDAAVADGTDYAGTVLLVTWGKEHVQPARFQGMDIGPFAMEVRILAGETPLQAKRRAMLHLNAMAEEEFAQKLSSFLERVRESEKNL